MVVLFCILTSFPARASEEDKVRIMNTVVEFYVHVNEAGIEADLSRKISDWYNNKKIQFGPTGDATAEYDRETGIITISENVLNRPLNYDLTIDVANSLFHEFIHTEQGRMNWNSSVEKNYMGLEHHCEREAYYRTLDFMRECAGRRMKALLATMNMTADVCEQVKVAREVRSLFQLWQVYNNDIKSKDIAEQRPKAVQAIDDAKKAMDDAVKELTALENAIHDLDAAIKSGQKGDELKIQLVEFEDLAKKKKHQTELLNQDYQKKYNDVYWNNPWFTMRDKDVMKYAEDTVVSTIKDMTDIVDKAKSAGCDKKKDAKAPADTPSPGATSPSSGTTAGGYWKLTDVKDSSQYFTSSEPKAGNFSTSESKEVTFSGSSMTSSRKGTNAVMIGNSDQVTRVPFVEQQVTSWTDLPKLIVPGVSFSTTLKIAWKPEVARSRDRVSFSAPSGDGAWIEFDFFASKEKIRRGSTSGDGSWGDFDTKVMEATTECQWKLNDPWHRGGVLGQPHFSAFAQVHGSGPGGTGDRMYRYDWVAGPMPAAPPVPLEVNVTTDTPMPKLGDTVMLSTQVTGGTAPYSTQPVRGGGSSEVPRLIRRVEPEYPSVAYNARVEGVVILEATIEPNGRVSNVTVIHGIPLLDQAAIDAVRQWVYEPLKQTVPLIMTVTVTFTLNSRSVD